MFTFLLKFLPVAISWYFYLLRSVLRQIQSMCRHWNQDILGVMRGAQIVLNAMLKHQEMQCSQIWKTSSMRNVVEETCSSLDRRIGQISSGSVQVSTYSHRCIVCWNSNLYESFEAVLLSVIYFHFVIMKNTRLSMVQESYLGIVILAIIIVNYQEKTNPTLWILPMKK